MKTDAASNAVTITIYTKYFILSIENYLSTFAGVAIFSNSSVKLVVDIIPYGLGVVIRLAFGPNGRIKYCVPIYNLIEACEMFRIDIDLYYSLLKTDIPKDKLTYIIVEDGKIIYLIKDFDNPQNWGAKGVGRDIAAILGALTPQNYWINLARLVCRTFFNFQKKSMPMRREVSQ